LIFGVIRKTEKPTIEQVDKGMPKSKGRGHNPLDPEKSVSDLDRETDLEEGIKSKAKGLKARRRLMIVFIATIVVFALATGFVALYFETYPPSEDGPLTPLFQELYAKFLQAVQPETQEQEDTASEQEALAPSEQPSDQKQDQTNVYAATTSGKIKDSLADVPERVYVPDVSRGVVDVIDPQTFQIVDHYQVGQLPYHVTPSWDMSELLVNDEGSSTFTVVDPGTGKPSGTLSAPFPYNLYYTPDGTKAIVVNERQQQLEFRDPKTWEVLGTVYIPWPGVDHLDFSADGSYFLASSEWSGVVSKVDTNKMELVDHVQVGSLPIDIKLSPDGSVFYVADQGNMGVFVIEPEAMKVIDFIPTGEGAHGLEFSRDTRYMYVSNRMEGTISVVDLATRKVADTWTTGGTPDMLQLSPDGKELWVSGRYDGAVYVLDTASGKLLHTIYTGTEPHGLTYFPNPGRFSLGHDGVYR
jgi:YVTN family beta-propeller protein